MTQKGVMFMHLQFCEIAIVFFLFSFLGWCMEVFLKLIQEHILVNRGFFIGPYCPIYGFGVIFIIFMIGDVLTLPYGVLPIFFSGMVICGALEYFVSWFLEKRYHARWWDYSSKPFNIHGRVWIGNLILFGIASVIIMFCIEPLLQILLSKISETIKWMISAIIIVIMSTDALLTKHAMVVIRNQIDGYSPDDTEEISYYIHEYLHQMPYTIRHLGKAFPSSQISESMIKEKIISTIQNRKTEIQQELKDQFSKTEQKLLSGKSVYNSINVKKEEKEENE